MLERSIEISIKSFLKLPKVYLCQGCTETAFLEKDMRDLSYFEPIVKKRLDRFQRTSLLYVPPPTQSVVRNLVNFVEVRKLEGVLIVTNWDRVLNLHR